MSDSDQNPRPLINDGHPFGHLIGLEFSAWGEGQSSCHLEVKPALLNPNGVLHGAVIYAMADTGMGGALVSTLEAGQVCSTVEIKISYFRAILAGRLRCDARVIQKGKRLAFLEAAIYQDDALIAQATGTFAIGQIKAKVVHE
ncbi:MAG: PaaI family thioesterase [Ardenticatenaceae bacterium]|nr:PaaI family thioesterase [Anaerolineales bacterium]MCB8940504.1 PaaI family thioesterase [Ardenticatenaceae bacterium]MCB8973525.1 PaaI family thioesterase [Ardenticatenaceae bacterium]